MAEIPDVVPGSDIESTWGNLIRSRAVMRYPNAAARDGSVTLPVAGDLAYLTGAPTSFTIYNGATWDAYPISTELDQYLTQAEGDALYLPIGTPLFTQADADLLYLPIIGTFLMPEAPVDGSQYARQDAGWSIVTGGGGGIPEAPADGQQYARKDLAWAIVSGFNPFNGAHSGLSGIGTSDHHVRYSDADAQAANASAINSKLPLAGGTLTGSLFCNANTYLKATPITTIAPNTHTQDSDGLVYISSSVLAVMNAADEVAVNARVAGAVELQSEPGAEEGTVSATVLNMRTVIDSLLDRIEALEAHHP